MQKLEISQSVIFGVFATLMFCLCSPQTVFSQTKKLGIVSFTSPKGMDKLQKGNVVAFSELNQATGKYCIVTLYGATPGTGSPQGDFKREWNNLVVTTMKADANPKTEEQKDGEWTAVSAGSEVESAELGKAVGFLTVISGLRTTVSVLAVFNDPACGGAVDQLVGSVELDKATQPASNTATNNPASGTATFDDGGDLVIPQPLRQLTTSDLAGAWIDGPNRMTTEYVYSGSGKSAGRDTTAFEVKTTFRSDGTYSSFFNSVRKKYETESTTTTGPYSIDGRLLSIQGKGYSGKTITTTKWVIRGWLELPSMTVILLAGPWSDDAPIPEVNFTDFGPDSRFRGTTRWVRIK